MMRGQRGTHTSGRGVGQTTTTAGAGQTGTTTATGHTGTQVGVGQMGTQTTGTAVGHTGTQVGGQEVGHTGVQVGAMAGGTAVHAGGAGAISQGGTLPPFTWTSLPAASDRPPPSGARRPGAISAMAWVVRAEARTPTQMRKAAP